VYIDTGKARKISLATVVIEPTTFGMLAQIFQIFGIILACPVWIYTQSNITDILFT
jgi:hypothetical protein